ncbi:spore germination protein GerPE [Metabacillus malikii]|uniref:Spore germination protein PE n=1 Tax=Metabacillus malikii TaxID=1504265 RepID=A0ABT9ZJ00_9BACI|nr:spore germination protein GerPE [Metabacillus malikii]MDQ0232246.1 spore germination protein PE [Metabacillus malikii]
MISRFSKVKSVYVNSIGLSSVFSIGDSMNITPNVKVLAEQREEEKYFGNEGNLHQYPVFDEDIPYPIFYERITTSFFHENASINVNTVSVTALSSAAVFQIGSSKDIKCESRILHIRHPLD